MQLISSRSDRGDTLIEVLFAITIFSLIAVGGLSIMNQGVSTSQRALEINLVKQEINAQAETLRFMNSSYISAFGLGNINGSNPAVEWSKMKQYIDSSAWTSASPFSNILDCSQNKNSISSRNYFILDTVNAKFISKSVGNFNLANTYSQVDNSLSPVAANGIWIEAIHPSVDPANTNFQSGADYIDFHIRACWDSPGQSAPVTLGTIVRLYEPR